MSLLLEIAESVLDAGILGLIVAVLLYYVLKSKEQVDEKLLSMLDGKLDELIKSQTHYAKALDELLRKQSEVISTLKEISIKQDVMIEELRARKRRVKTQ